MSTKRILDQTPPGWRSELRPSILIRPGKKLPTPSRIGDPCESSCTLQLFEVARLRAGASEKHPPQIVYIMPFGLGLGVTAGGIWDGLGPPHAAGFTW